MLAKLCCLVLFIGLAGCATDEEFDWELTENEYSGTFTVLGIAWEQSESTLLWKVEIDNDNGYTYSGERGVGIEFTALSADGSTQSVSEGFIPEVRDGDHSILGKVATDEAPVSAKIKFIE